SGLSLIPNRHDLKPDQRWIERLAQTLAVIVNHLRCQLTTLRLDANRSQFSETRLPQTLSCRERDERFRCRAILVPVIFVLLAHSIEMDRERRIPCRHVFRLSN